MRQESLRLDSPPPGYVIDTSALIDLHRVHYAPDVFKSLWTKLGELVERRVKCRHPISTTLASTHGRSLPAQFDTTGERCYI